MFVYLGKQDPLPEPEALELPDDLQLDDGEAKEDDAEEENPFDIDTMKGTHLLCYETMLLQISNNSLQ